MSPWGISLSEAGTVLPHIDACPFTKEPLDPLVFQLVAANLQCFRKDRRSVWSGPAGAAVSEGNGSVFKFDEQELWECLRFELIFFNYQFWNLRLLKLEDGFEMVQSCPSAPDV